MLHWTLQWPQFIAVAVANFLLGWLWYSPAAPWFKAWAKAAGLKPDKGMTKEQQQRLPLLFGGAIVSCLGLSLVLQVLVRSLGAQSFTDGAVLGLALWAGLCVPVTLGSLWEGRKNLLVVLALANYLVICLGFGGVLAIWR